MSDKAMGYVPRNEWGSGLTRKTTPPANTSASTGVPNDVTWDKVNIPWDKMTGTWDNPGIASTSKVAVPTATTSGSAKN